MKNNKKLQIITTTSLIFTMTTAMALKPTLVLADEGVATAGQFTAGEVEEGEGTIAAPEQPADPVVPEEIPAEPTPAVPSTPTEQPETPVAPTPTPEPEAPVTPANPMDPTTPEKPVITPAPENPSEPVEPTSIPEPSKPIDLVKSVDYETKPTIKTMNSKKNIIETGIRTNVFLSFPTVILALFVELFVLRKKKE